MEKIHDVIIAGGGPAGLTAGIYAVRAGMDVVIVEEVFCGGLVNFTVDIENYPGFPGGVKGQELALRFYNQAKELGCGFVEGKSVTSLEFEGDIKMFRLSDGTLVKGKSAIIATGSRPRKLGLPGEEKFVGKGVSFCAVCDGSFFKDKEVAVVGGGNSALQEALYLSNIVKKVYLLHRRDAFRADKALQKRVLSSDRIEFVPNTVIKELVGEDGLEGLVIKNKVTGGERFLKVEGLFVYIGNEPNTGFLKGVLDLDDGGYVITDESMGTSVPGVFAAGDVRSKELRQIVTAASDGAIAGSSAARYVEEFFGKDRSGS